MKIACKNSSPGPDSIPYAFIKNLPEAGSNRLLSIYNQIWTTQTFPEQCRLFHVIRITKPGKDKKKLQTNFSNLHLLRARRLRK